MGRSTKARTGIKFRLVVIMTVLVAGTVFVCWFVIRTFLGRYYTYRKLSELAGSYEAIDRAGTENELGSESFAIEFERICATKNIDIIIIGVGNEVVLSYSPNEQQFQSQLWNMIWGIDNYGTETLRSNGQYEILKQNDTRTGFEYMTLIGLLKNGDYIYMKTPLESIRESAESTSHFFLVIGIGSTIASIFIIYFAAKSISLPILELSDVSRRMCNLDFDAKYEPKRRPSRELQMLGNNMNELSETLQTTISELKGANNELKNDILKKEQIDGMRKEFLSNVSHELKTPLALISGYAEGLKECVDDSKEGREFYCDVIIDESNKMNRMVGKLLTLNQLEFGNERIDMVRFDMTGLIRGVVQANSLPAAAGGISVCFDETEPAYVWADEFLAEEVITNYLGNALHYAAGEKRVRIYYETSGDLLRVCVFNSGENIPEEELDKIWIKFYKVDKARTREYGGSGIGLSIVRAVMESLHRACGVYNVRDGVVFWMELERDRK